MKLPAISRPCRGGLAVAAICSMTAASIPSRADVITLPAEADTAVDTLAPFPYQGSATTLYAGYDPGFGPWIVRSYLRFSLAGVSSVDRILSAKLNLNSNLVLQGGSVDLYRSANDSWDEYATNFSNQPGWSGARLDTLFITSLGVKSFELLRLGNWEPWMDIVDGKLTLVIKTQELSRMDGVRFDSREGAVPPTLVLTTRGRGAVVNPGFDDGLSGYGTSGNVSIATPPDDPTNPAALLQTASQSGIWQPIDTPNTLFAIVFNSDFLTSTGTFSVSRGGVVLLTVTAPDSPRGGFMVSDRSLRNRNDLDLKFTLDGPDGVTSELFLDDIGIIEIPEPQLAIGADEARENITLSIYTLDAMVGKRHDIGFPNASPPDLILRAGGVALVPDESESPDPAPKTFELWVRKFRIGKTHPQLGQPLEIILDGGESGVTSQVNIDSVVLGIE